MHAPRHPDLDVKGIRLAWDFAARELELQRQQLVQLFTVFVTAAVTAFAAAMLERVSWTQAALVMLAAIIGASYVQLRLRQLQDRLRQAYRLGRRSIERLKETEEEDDA